MNWISHNKRHWTCLLIVNDQSSHLVYPNISIKKQAGENLSSIGHRSCEKMMKAKTTLLDEFVCFQTEINSEKLHFSQNLCYFRGSRFSQCCILSTALHWSLPSYQLIFVLSNYQTIPFKQHHSFKIYIILYTCQSTGW